MSYQALYRKWRPETFDNVVGQDAVMTTLKNQVSSGRIGHAYLFCGTRGTGKTSAAKIMARAVNCPHSKEHGGNPCNECEICKSIKNGTSMNVFEIDAASNNGVDNIRDIRDEVEYPPVTGRYKVYIIDEVHMLSTGAFNALLKTLEEPPSYVIFILATTDPQKLPATILSRCQRYDFRRMSRKNAAEHLKMIAQTEGMDAEDKALSYIAEAADGSMRDALSLLDQCMSYHFNDRLTYDNVLEIIGAADPSVFSRLYRQIIESDAENALHTVNELINSGADIIQLINDFIWYLRNVLLAGSIEKGQEDILDISSERFEQAKNDAGLTDRRELVSILGSLAELTNRARFSAQKRALFEVEIIRLCTKGTMSAASTAAQTGTDSIIRKPRIAAVQKPVLRIDSEADSYSSGISSSKTTANDDVPWQVTENANIAEAYDRQTVPGGESVTISEEQPCDSLSREEQMTETNDFIQQDAEAGNVIDILREHWTELVGRLMPSNRPLFAGAILKEENGNIVVVFKNNMNYKLAAKNIEENGVLKLRELAAQLTGETVKMVARIARPGEIEVMNNRATDEELSRINFHIDIEG
ncbi:MAG: DNA polymerase III subunit gamma/tau [Lachnospiraceae bacterium]|nr:DNA polymerase III subunit gamma/tau [Lachnospiraceae bacterium]